ncbi:polysaccharide lyase 8 family protein [Micromonospora globbae]|uniref:polysaccharide lyase 8 family protein n=1 Tax=Micromonospora globbae TaxID=1894969 RepID=UPI00342CBC16
MRVPRPTPHQHTPTSRIARPSRRQLLAAAGGAAALAAVGVPDIADATTAARMTGAATPAIDVFDTLRLRWRDALTGGTVDRADSRIAAAIQKLGTDATNAQNVIDRSASRTRVFTDIPIRDVTNPNDKTDSYNVTRTYMRLAAMAEAWATEGTTVYQDASLLADILAGLRTICDLAYNANASEYKNWWDWEIGSPANLVNACTLVYDELTATDLADYLAAIDHFVPDPSYNMQGQYREVSTGANRADLCLIVTVRGILGKSDIKVRQGRDALTGIFTYVSSGDGLYRDGSYIHHVSVAYTGAYGVIMLGRTTSLISLLAGSSYQVTDPGRANFLDAVDRTYAPVIFNNQMMDMVRGRSISRYSETGHSQAHSVIEQVLVLADYVQASDPARAARWRSMCRGWIARDTYDDVFAGAKVRRIAIIERLLADTTVQPADEPTAFILCTGMGRAVHRRPGWALGIAMASKHVKFYESIAGENKKGFHTGEGTTYLYNDADNSQFEDDFWPSVDLYRLPGTTLNKMIIPDTNGARTNGAAWVGGVSYNGTYGAVGMDLRGCQPNALVGVQDPLKARKSWFCFDKYVVCLGAGITDVSGYPVETIVENRNLHVTGVNALLLDGVAQPTDQGWSVRHQVGWAHLEGVGGYIFPGGATINALRDVHSGTWSNIGGSGTNTVSRRYLTMWFDHGTNPSGASYAYVLMPGASGTATSNLAASPDYAITSNTAELQSVRVGRLGLQGINFFLAGSHASVTVDQPCSVMLFRQLHDLVLAVADPTLSASIINISLGFAGYTLVSADPTVTVIQTSPGIVLKVNTSGSVGATHTVRFTNA